MNRDQYHSNCSIPQDPTIARDEDVILLREARDGVVAKGVAPEAAAASRAKPPAAAIREPSPLRPRHAPAATSASLTKGDLVRSPGREGAAGDVSQASFSFRFPTPSYTVHFEVVNFRIRRGLKL